MADIILKLTLELQGIVYSHLDVASLLGLRLVCKEFNNNAYLIRTIYGTSVLKSSEKSAKRFLEFCKNESLTAMVKDFTLDFGLVHMVDDADASPLNYRIRQYTGEEFSTVIRSAISEIPKTLTNLTTLRVRCDPYQKLGYHLHSDWYRECINLLFPGEVPVAPSGEEEQETESSITVSDHGLPLEPVFKKLQSLVMTGIDVRPVEIFMVPSFRELLSRVKSLSIQTSEDTEFTGWDWEYTDFEPLREWTESRFSECFLKPLGPCIRSLEVKFPLMSPYTCSFEGTDDTLTENLTRLSLDHVCLTKETIDFISSLKNLKDLTLVNCAINAGDSEEITDAEVFWSDLWKVFLEKEAETGKKTFNNLELVDTGYACLVDGSEWFHFEPWVPMADGDYEEDELEDNQRVTEIMGLDMELYKELGGKGSIFKEKEDPEDASEKSSAEDDENDSD